MSSPLRLRRPATVSDETLYDLHKSAYSYLSEKLGPVWSDFADGCESICLISDEIIDNRFKHNTSTRSLDFKLEVQSSGEGSLKISHDGLLFNDLTEVKSSQVVKEFVQRMKDNHGGEFSVSNETVTLGETPRASLILKFKLNKNPAK